MKIRVVVTDSAGNTYEGEATLVSVVGVHPPLSTPGRKPRAPLPARTGPDFSLPVRAFAKRHARGLGGPQKFTVLLARLSGGRTGASIARADIEKAWNRMTELMDGRFNSAYSTRARDNGWVDTTKTGHYTLRPGWAAALGE